MPSHERAIQQIHYSLKKEIDELYWAIAIKNFAVGLISIFGPIYVFLLFDRSVSATFFFYLAGSAGQVLFLPLAAKLIGRLGIKKLMAIANPFLGFYLLMLVFAQEGGFVFVVLAVIMRIVYLTLFWPARHINFSRFANKEKRGRQIGIANIIVALVKTAAPLLGGLIIIQFGFTTLFIAAAILIAISSGPLFFSPEVYEYYSLSWFQSFRKIFEKEHRRTSLAFFFEGMEYLASWLIFSIFIFLIIGRLDTIGWVTSLALLAALIFTYLVGWISDKRGSGRMISFTSVAHAFAWLINSFIRTPMQYLIFSSFLRLAETANHLPFISLFYSRAKQEGHGIDEYIVFHEIAHNIGRIVMALVVIIGFSLGFNSWFFYFSLAGFSAFLYRLINRQQEPFRLRLKRILRII